MTRLKLWSMFFILSILASCGGVSDSADPVPPEAHFSFSPEPATAGQPVTFDASSSSDSDGAIVEYNWDFDGDGHFDQANSTSSATHTYAAAGDYQITLEVVGQDEQTSRKRQPLTVKSGNNSPDANFTYSPSDPEAGQEVSFDASGSTDQDGTVEEYQWDFDGDGSWELAAGSPTTSYTYSAKGSYNVILKVVDDGEANAEASKTISVSSSNSPPTADFTYSPSDPQTGEEVTFDASSATDPDGLIEEYHWDLDGDGSFELMTTTARTSRAYSSSGSFDISLKVVDDKGSAADITETITISKANTPPSADFSYSPSHPVVGEMVTLDASGSYDSDGGIISFHWDLDGDGTYDYVSETSDTYTTSYSNAGNYDVTLKVYDDDQAVDRYTQTIPVGTGNTPPSADFSFSPSSPAAGEEVSFDASGSTDPDGSVVEYQWDFDGDGSWEVVATTPGTSHSYSSSGSYRVTLEVVDDGEAVSQTDKTISIDAK